MTAGAIGIAVAALSTLGLMCRVVVGYLQERDRWRAIERLASEHGREVIDTLPNLVREVRGEPWHASIGRSRASDPAEDGQSDTGRPDGGLPRRRRGGR